MFRITSAIVFSLAALPVLAQDQDIDRSDWPNTLVVGTASPGGTFAIYGQGIASLISEHVGVSGSTQQTQGPTQNLVLVNSQRVDLGMTTMGPAYEALIGELDLDPGTEYTDIRALFPMYITPFQAAAAVSSGITSISDFEGRTVGTGPRGGTGGTYWERWFDELGVNVNVQNGPLGDQTSQLADGRLDAVATAAGLPISAFSELEALTDTVIFGLTSEEIATLRETVPYAQPYTIPAEAYASLDAPVETLAMWNVAIAHKDMSESLAYEIVKAVFENQGDLISTHAAAAETILENVSQNDFLAYHPGAIRYFREVGVDVPAGTIPEEMQ